MLNINVGLPGMVLTILQDFLDFKPLISCTPRNVCLVPLYPREVMVDLSIVMLFQKLSIYFDGQHRKMSPVETEVEFDEIID